MNYNIDQRRREEFPLENYATEVFHKVDWLFKQRRVEIVSGEQFNYGELLIEGAEVQEVAQVFEERWIDAPHTIEITLLDGREGSESDRGVMIITQNDDHDSLYTFMYEIYVHNAEGRAPSVVKSAHRSPLDRDHNEYGLADNPYMKMEILCEDKPADELEREALLAMIEKLL